MVVFDSDGRARLVEVLSGTGAAFCELLEDTTLAGSST